MISTTDPIFVKKVYYLVFFMWFLVIPVWWYFFEWQAALAWFLGGFTVPNMNAVERGIPQVNLR